MCELRTESARKQQLLHSAATKGGHFNGKRGTGSVSMGDTAALVQAPRIGGGMPSLHGEVKP
ncbi:MAG: hypothetical protein EOO65_00955 [Methanosarcinales archaeon]|nr:MAG: hypothetical protein EOO65_00955 [Methanosarcinales archaeon]